MHVAVKESGMGNFVPGELPPKVILSIERKCFISHVWCLQRGSLMRDIMEKIKNGT